MTRDVQSTPHYDLVVIGSGQGGNPLASEFAHAGKRVALVEREHIGGTCINDGCSPTKTMIATARVAHVARRASEYGVHSGDVSVDLRRVRARKAEIVERFRQGSERGLADSGVDVLRGQATFVGERTLAVRGLNPPVTLTAETAVINTGLAPAIPDIQGLDTVAYLTSTSVMELDHVPEQLIVMGGGYVGRVRADVPPLRQCRHSHPA